MQPAGSHQHKVGLARGLAEDLLLVAFRRGDTYGGLEGEIPLRLGQTGAQQVGPGLVAVVLQQQGNAQGAGGRGLVIPAGLGNRSIRGRRDGQGGKNKGNKQPQ